MSAIEKRLIHKWQHHFIEKSRYNQRLEDRVAEGGFRCLVILEKGTNEALPSVNTSAEGEEKLLWMRNKWLTCHPDSPQKGNGAFVGIRGENLRLKI